MTRRRSVLTRGALRALALWCALFSLPVASTAQEVDARSAGSGELRGVVRDSLGGVLPGTTVTATASTGTVHVAYTLETGEFVLAALPAGVYSVRAELAGFLPAVQDGVTMAPGVVLTVEMALQVQPYGETVVVTGSRREEMLLHTPAAVTVLGSQEIASQPVQNYGDLLRRVPGVNLIQFSARDVQFTARGATSQSSNKTLALLDGRPVYQPYFGMIIWDLLPVDFDEIKQVEVVRGPGSAMWGTNALTGVVNIITKAPAEEPGTHVRLGVGDGATGDVNVRHVGVRGRVGYKLGASMFTQEAWERPSALPDGTPLPAYANLGTTRWQTNARLDVQQGEGRWRFDGGYATSDGVQVTVIGPLDSRDLAQGFARAEYERGTTRFSASLDAHDASFVGILSGDRTDFTYQTVQAEAEHRLVRPRHALTLAGIVRSSHFDINVVPDQHARHELGVVADDEFLLSDRVRLRAGGRLDWFSSFGATLSPRVGVMLEPARNQTLRASYNRAYVAPSFLENYFRLPTQTVIGLPTGPYTLPFLSQGSDSLDPLTIDAFEVGYTGVVGSRATFGAAVYHNRTRGLITLVPTALWSPADPPPAWPLPPELLALLPLPKVLTEANLGRITNSGLELSADVQPVPAVSAYVNYALQGEPDVSDDVPIAINVPARHRVNAGIAVSRGRYFGNISTSTSSRAFWADVQPFSGFTERYTLVNGAAGVRLAVGNRPVTLSIKVVNLGNDAIRQHIFGDVLRRRIVGELRFDF